MASNGSGATPSHTLGPSLTVVVPFAGTDVYVEDLLTSIPPPGQEGIDLELLLVVAPSGRRSLARQMADADPRVRIVEAADDQTLEVRRTGLRAARADWIMFPEPDSVFGSDMLSSLGAYLTTHPRAAAVALNTKRVVHHTGTQRDTHQGRWRFDGGDREVDLREHPEFVQMQFESCVLRTDSLRRAEAQLEPAMSASNDPLAVAAVLAASETPHLGLVASALYYERIRSFADREFARFRSSSSNYLGRARLAVALADGAEAATHANRWRAWAIIAEAATILRHEVATPRRATALTAEERVEFIDLFRTALRWCGAAAVDEFASVAVPRETRAVLRAWAGGDGPTEVRRARTDRRSGQALVRYYFVGSPPDEAYFAADGRRLPLLAGKVRAVDYFGQQVLRERIAWLADDVTSAVIDDVAHPVDRSSAAVLRVRKRRDLRAAVKAARRSWLSRAAAIRALSKVPGIWRRFDDAWVLMDRADLAGDNAEHLYRWLRRHRPQVNSWFVLRKDSPDFVRLRSEGFRLMRYGSIAHQVLLYRAKEYLSSHAGVDVLRPMGDRLVTLDPRWRFTFLQHGVIHNDLSIWLNSQKFDVFVTSTHDEYEGIVGDGSPYLFTDREVKLVGMPRFDTLRHLADSRPWSERKTLLIAPTWRNSLFLPAARPGERRIPRPDFAESEYITSLAGVLGDERLRELAEREGLQIVFLPHPNIGEHFPRRLIPSHVRVSSYASEDVQQLLADARVFLTDYSSVAFDAAYADAAVVYLQTDAGSIFGGDHTLHPGYFRFEEHGFGPVVRSADEAAEALMVAISSPEATERYRERARETFAWWDGGNCQRLVEALEGTS